MERGREGAGPSERLAPARRSGVPAPERAPARGAALLHLQRTVGNRAVAQLVSRDGDETIPGMTRTEGRKGRFTLSMPGVIDPELFGEPMSEEPLEDLRPVPIFDVTGRSLERVLGPQPVPRIPQRDPGIRAEIDLLLLRMEAERLRRERQGQMTRTARRLRYLESMLKRLRQVPQAFQAIEPWMSRLGQHKDKVPFETYKVQREKLYKEEERIRGSVTGIGRQVDQVDRAAPGDTTALDQLGQQLRTLEEELLRHGSEVSEFVVTLKQAFEQLVPKEKQGAKPVRDIVVNGTMTPANAAKEFPLAIANANDVASDIINSPTSGNTGFKVRGNIVYHSSAGSRRAGNQAGTAFWIVQGGDRILVAMGRHTGGNSDQYRITWRSPGVTGYLVKLNSTKPNEALVG